MRLTLIAAAVLYLVSPLARADNEDSFAKYLRDTGLTVADCLQRSPRDLMGWITERQKLRSTGTPGGEQKNIELFYQTYRATLRPVIDSRYPEAKAMREPLQKLHCFIYDYMSSIRGDRTYVTHDRIAAYTEHVLARFYSSPGGLSLYAANGRPTHADVASFARLKAAIWNSYGGDLRPNYDRYTADLLSHLKAVEAAGPAIEAFEIRIHIVDFIDQYVRLLNPNAFDSR